MWGLWQDIFLGWSSTETCTNSHWTYNVTHKCEDCDKIFSQAGHLHGHVLNNTGQQMNRCKACDKAFYQANNLQTCTHSHCKLSICFHVLWPIKVGLVWNHWVQWTHWDFSTKSTKRKNPTNPPFKFFDIWKYCLF